MLNLRAAVIAGLSKRKLIFQGIVNLTACSQRDAHREGRALMIMPL
jgi:hypothetical protein